MSLTTPWRVGWGVLGSMGPRWAAYRAVRALELRLGVLERRAPRRRWDQVPSPVGPLELGWFGRNVLQPPPSELTLLLAEADAIEHGRFRLFEGNEVDLGALPDWHRNPVSGHSLPGDVHWSRLHEFDYGDVKACWELGRMRFGFVLARAYAHTADEQYARHFWRLFEHWCSHNPPNTGVHWRCGQESSLRLIACVFAASVLRNADATSRQHEDLFGRFVHVTAERIVAHLSYALSQHNNHGVSECVGLLTAASVLPSAKEAERWRARALAQLEAELARLLYCDGGFAQHSLVYQRLLLQLLTWSHWLLLHGANGPPDWLTAALRRCHQLLDILSDPNTGQATVFGPDDGTQLLVLQVAGYHDLRPALHAAAATLAHVGVHAHTSLQKSEAAAWFSTRPAEGGELRRLARAQGSESARAPATLPLHPLQLYPLAVTTGRAWHASQAGLMHWQNQALALLLRCPTEFAHRPSQLDMLAIGLQCAGTPVVIDPGTYSYNAAPPFEDAFCSARVHSVPHAVGLEPASRLSRFLYYPWPHGRAQFDPGEQRFTASHDGYERAGMRLVREVRAVGDGQFEIVDRIHCKSRCSVAVSWLLADVQWQPVLPKGTVEGDTSRPAQPLASQTGQYVARLGAQQVSLSWTASAPAQSVSWVRADAASDRGWYAPRYLQLAAACSLQLRFLVRGLVVVRTRFRSVCVEQDMMAVSGAGRGLRK